MEERLARIESHLEHVQADVTEVKSRLDRLDAKIDSVDQRQSARFDGLSDRLIFTERSMVAGFEKTNAAIAQPALSTERSLSRLTRWGLLLYITLGATLLGVMAHGFKWL